MINPRPRGSRSELQWVVDAYALVLAATMLGAGDLADRLGSRRLFLGGLALFGVASSACALAPSAAVLIAARAVQDNGRRGVGILAARRSSFMNHLHGPGHVLLRVGNHDEVGKVGLCGQRGFLIII